MKSKTPFFEMVSRGKMHVTGVFVTVHLQVIETTCTVGERSKGGGQKGDDASSRNFHI